MTDKQIIIDGIDVSGCKYIIDYDPPEWQRTWGGAIHKGACQRHSGDCKCNPNCYYKQLKAKEQECEELKEWKEKVVNLFNKTCRCKYLNEEDAHCSFYNKECIGAINQCLYKNQQTLTEIKEIAENAAKSLYVTKSDDYTDGYRWLGSIILQKISEVEDG